MTKEKSSSPFTLTVCPADQTLYYTKSCFKTFTTTNHDDAIYLHLSSTLGNILAIYNKSHSHVELNVLQQEVYNGYKQINSTLN